jgi:flagellar protein FlaG
MLVEAVNATKPVVNAGHDAGLSAKNQTQKGAEESQDNRRDDVDFLKDVLDVAQNHFNISGVSLDFSVHEATGTIKVDVRDKETGEVIREVPPQQVLDLMAKIDEMMGILYDQKV